MGNTLTFPLKNSTDFIPQRPPVVMIDEILSCAETSVETSLIVQESNIFVTDGVLTESGLLENIAQTGASMVGVNAHQKNQPVPLGFIGGINKVVIHQLPKVGDVITTQVDVEQEVFNITLISGKSFANGQPLAECKMKIVVNP